MLLKSSVTNIIDNFDILVPNFSMLPTITSVLYPCPPIIYKYPIIIRMDGGMDVDLPDLPL